MPANKDENGFEKLVGGYNLIASAEFAEAMVPIADVLYKYNKVLVEIGFTPSDAMLLTLQFQRYLFTLGKQ